MTQEIKTLISRYDDPCIQEYIQFLEPTWLKEKTNFCKLSSDYNTHKIKQNKHTKLQTGKNQMWKEI